MEFRNWVVVGDGFKCSWLLAEVAATIVGRALYAGLSMMGNGFERSALYVPTGTVRGDV